MDLKKDWVLRTSKKWTCKAWRCDKWQIWELEDGYHASRGHINLGVFDTASEAKNACKEDKSRFVSSCSEPIC